MPPKRRKTGYAGRSSARNSPCPERRRSKTAGSSHSLTTPSGSGSSFPADGRLLDRHGEAPGDAELPPVVFLDPQLADLDAIAQRLHGRRMQDDLALLRLVLGRRQLVDDAPGEDVDPLHGGIADLEAAGRPDGDGDLDREVDRRACRSNHDPGPLHRRLHRQRAGRRAHAVVAVEPAGDRVAAEVDDVTAEAVELLDEGVKDAVQLGRQLLRAALRSQLLAQRFGQRREARDVGEERRAAHPVRNLDPRGERAPAVAGDVGLGALEQIVRSCGRFVRRDAHRSNHRTSRAPAPPAALVTASSTRMRPCPGAAPTLRGKPVPR